MKHVGLCYRVYMGHKKRVLAIFDISKKLIFIVILLLNLINSIMLSLVVKFLDRSDLYLVTIGRLKSWKKLNLSK